MFDLNLITQQINQDTRILAAYLMGSAANGGMRPDSDVDIALLPKPGQKLSPLDLADMSVSITLSVGRVVDLGVITSQNLIYASEAILKGRRILCHNQFQTDLSVATLLGLTAQLKFERQEIQNGYTH